ncbi:MAG: hypothetical protein KIT34_05960 [Cyanobacteria bacterium TGS_CYA1]|nr:hypothetical protein [Cyanobacteria bacterium TGS_CYA1]
MKALIVLAISLTVFGISLLTFVPGFSMSGTWVYLSNANLIVNVILSITLFVSFIVFDWKKVDGAGSIRSTIAKGNGACAFVALMLITIIIPVVTILFESLTHYCASSFIDLVPTPFHFIVLILGPVLNLFCAGLLFQKVDIEPKTVNFLNGMALGISILFAIASLPMYFLMPIALLSGMAWMAYSALFAFIGTLRLFSLLTVFYPILKGHGKLRIAGLLTGLALVVLAQVPIWLTNAFACAATKNPENKSAVQMIKLFGDRQYLLRKCYISGNLNSMNEIALPPIDRDGARVIFKKVTGKEYNSVPKPAAVEQFESRLQD